MAVAAEGMRPERHPNKDIYDEKSRATSSLPLVWRRRHDRLAPFLTAAGLPHQARRCNTPWILLSFFYLFLGPLTR